MNENESLFTNEEDEYEYAGYAACTQYLGTSGITRKCVLGLVAILVSTFRPEKITMISLRQHGEKSDKVMFVVWDWLEKPDITIIPDGFGTHSGEGEVVSAQFWPLFGIIKSLWSISLSLTRPHSMSWLKKENFLSECFLL